MDPYSFTQDRPWINHEWLSELLMGVAWSIGGTAGLVLLKATLGLLALFVVWRAYRDADLGWRIMTTAAAAVASAQILQTFRPQVWSLLAMALLAARLPSASARRPLAYFLLFCVWADAHGGWILGLGVLVVWTVVSAVRDRTHAVAWFVVLASATAGTLATPYGWQLWRFIANTVRLTRPQIEDWAPLWNASPAKWVLWAATAALCAWLWTTQRRNRWETALVLIVLGAASVKVVRIVPLFGIGGIVLVAPGLASSRPRRALTPLAPHEARTAALVVTAGALAGAVWIGGSSLTCISRDPDRMPDPAIVGALSHGPPGRMVTFFNWGEYAIWHLGPAIRVSMDGRRETVYTDRRIQEHDDILFGRAEGLQTLAAWRPEYVWLPASSTVARDWLAANDYRIEMETDRAFLAVRRDLPFSRSPPPPARPCFPE
jgi:hypothetical protein